MSFTKQNQKTTTWTITSETGARRVIGRGGANIKEMRRNFGNGLYIRVEATKTRCVSADQLTEGGYVKMKCANSNGVTRTVSIFVGTSPPRDDDGNVLVMVKPVMVSGWGPRCVTEAIRQIDTITNRREDDLTTKVSNCPANLIKHVIGARGSGLRRIEREVGDGCYISCTDGVFVIKANSKKSALRSKIVVEKKIKELVQRFRAPGTKEKKAVVTSKSLSALSVNPFSIFGDDDGDDVVQEPARSACDGESQKKLSKSVARRNRRKEAKAKAETEKLASDAIATDETVLFVSPPQSTEEGDASYDDLVERTARNDAWMRPRGGTSDSSTVEDTVDTTSDSADSSPPLSGVWGAQAVTISESLEDAVTRGDTFAAPPAPKLKKRSRSHSKGTGLVPTAITFEVMADAATSSPKKLVLKRALPGMDDAACATAALNKKFDKMTEEFAVGAWASDSDDE